MLGLCFFGMFCPETGFRGLCGAFTVWGTPFSHSGFTRGYENYLKFGDRSGEMTVLGLEKSQNYDFRFVGIAWTSSREWAREQRTVLNSARVTEPRTKRKRKFHFLRFK